MKNKSSTRKKLYYLGIVLICMFVVLLVAFGIHCFNVTSYNNKERVLADEYEVADEINLTIKEGNSWEKADSALGEDKYKGMIYEATIKNLSVNELSKWTAKFVINSNCYINQAWCGSVEIHQFRNGEELIATIKDLRVAEEALEASTLDYIIDSTGTWLIDMEPGDYCIYYPDSDVGGEYPLDSNTDTTIGFIFYTKDEAIDLSSLSITYKLKEEYLTGLTGTIFIACFSFWVVLLIGYIVISIIINQYEKQLQTKEKIITEAFEVFSNFVDAKDPYTHGHSDRVADYSEKIAKKLGMSDKECENIYWIAKLHDIGKCYVPDNILNKPSKLTDDEFKQIKEHTIKGSEMVKDFSSIPGITEGALYHHERYDGKGYPTGKKGEEIPYIARIICVADSYDAMNSDRVYRKKLSKDKIIDELNKGKGSQFDPNIVDAFVELLKDGKV
jgi:putative nucleotidyltransferase with HDIG domain